MMAIYFYSTSDEYSDFSNFASKGVELDGQWWPTVEHYFQAQKFDDADYREKIRNAHHPKQAKALGRSRKIPIRPDWEEVKDEIMAAAVLKKFETHEKLRDRLLATRDQEIYENAPGDYYWGIGQDGTGQNKLGKILMDVRAKLRAKPYSALSIKGLEIPDPTQPYPPEQRTSISPSCKLIPFRPKPLKASDVVGRTIDEVTALAGTCGMGGAGFFGLRFGEDWLIIAISSAGDWIEYEGRLVVDGFWQDRGRDKPWIGEFEREAFDRDFFDGLSPRVVGSKVRTINIQEKSLTIGLSDRSRLEINESAEARPIFEGNGKPRELMPDDDLRKAVFMAPTTEIWV